MTATVTTVRQCVMVPRLIVDRILLIANDCTVEETMVRLVQEAMPKLKDGTHPLMHWLLEPKPINFNSVDSVLNFQLELPEKVASFLETLARYRWQKTSTVICNILLLSFTW